MLKKLKFIIKLFLTSMLFLVFTNIVFAQENTSNIKILDCYITFDLGKTTFKTTVLENCFMQVLKDYVVQDVYILTSASSGGSSKYNKELTDKRAKALLSFINEKFKNVKATISSIGINEKFGRIGHIRIISTGKKKDLKPFIITIEKLKEDEEKKQLLYEKKADSNPSKFYLHGALRIGRDIFIPAVQVAYLAIGGEVGLEYQQKEWFRYELAIQGNILENVTNDNVLNLSNYDLTPGFYYTNSGFLIGLRGLIGQYTNENGSVVIDLGGEVRAGYEYKMFTFILDAGRTTNNIRLGLNIGLKFEL